MLHFGGWYLSQVYSFCAGDKKPFTEEEKTFTAWQEGVKKDIEHAFGVAKGKFQVLDQPIMLYNLKDIAVRVMSCMLLHNIVVADHVIENNYDVDYDPAAMEVATMQVKLKLHLHLLLIWLSRDFMTMK